MAQQKRTRRAWIAIGATLVGVVAVGTVAATGTASAAPVASLIFTSTLTTSASTGAWSLTGAAPGDMNQACSTSGIDNGTPIPGCGSATFDSAGVQLTGGSISQNTEGGIVYGSPVLTAGGLDVKYTTDQYGGGGSGGPADGIALFLSTPPDSGVPSLGTSGGHLGYSADPSGINAIPHNTSTPGLTNAYMGVGLDPYGNFASSDYDGSGCGASNPTVKPGIDVRGGASDGNDVNGYCLMQAQVASGPLRADAGGVNADVPVEVAINPTSSPMWAAGLGGRTLVKAHQYLVEVQPLTGDLQTLSGNLPQGVTPNSLDLGFSATTGGSTDFHAVHDVSVSTLAGDATQLAFTGPPKNSTVDSPGIGDVVVAAEDGTSAVDSNYTGLVTLALSDPTATLSPTSATVTQPLGSTSTLQTYAVAGLADFGALTVNKAGTYTLSATTADLPTATSVSFTVTVVEADCSTTNTCVAILPAAGVNSLTTVAAPGATGGHIEAYYGGTSAPIATCKAGPTSILTFSGPGVRKTITFNMTGVTPTISSVLKFCYGQPDPFVDWLGKKAVFHSANAEYEAVLPVCLPNFPKLLSPSNPCFTVTALNLKAGTETAVVYSGLGETDPKIAKF
jgi:large repetitive protein